jgi:isochorismate hydrolase
MTGNCLLTTTEQDSVLVVMDIQERLTAAMTNGVRERLIAQVSILLSASAALSVPVIVTEQYPKGLGPTELALKSLLSESVSSACIEKVVIRCFFLYIVLARFKAMVNIQVDNFAIG